MAGRLLLIPILLVSWTLTPSTTGETVASTRDTSLTASSFQKMAYVTEHDPAMALITPDSTLYIGEIATFVETGEVYTPVYYRSHLQTEGIYDSLREQTDSLIFEDIERRRSRLPIEIAKKYFELSGLDSIHVYAKGYLVGKARFIRVEYLDDVIAGEYVAVFRWDGSSTAPHQLDYCISAGQHKYKAVNMLYENIDNEDLTMDILNKFAPEAEQVWNVVHMRIMPDGSVYSAISLQSRLLLLETEEGQSRILSTVNEDWVISGITPVHLEINGKPILLLRMGVKDTDFIWTSLAIFSGEQYEFYAHNRLKDL